MKRTCTCKAYQVPVFAHETITSSKTAPLVTYDLVATSDSLLVTLDTRMDIQSKQ